MSDVRSMALAFLDEVSAPLTARELERALREHGVSKSQSSVLTNAIRHLNIIAVQLKETRND